MTPQTKQALKMTIEAMDYLSAVVQRQLSTKSKQKYSLVLYKDAINACKEALSEQEPAQEPVGWIPATYKYNLLSNDDEYPIGMVYHSKRDEDDVAVYTHPHQWQGLSDDEICDLWTLSDKDLDGIDLGYTTQQHYFAALIEQALKEKNT
jgi:hypothetical protein